jgi:hypothetical protein
VGTIRAFKHIKCILKNSSFIRDNIGIMCLPFFTAASSMQVSWAFGLCFLFHGRGWTKNALSVLQQNQKPESPWLVHHPGEAHGPSIFDFHSP